MLESRAYETWARVVEPGDEAAGYLVAALGVEESLEALS